MKNGILKPTTKSNKPLHSNELTVAQENAVDALACGKNDAETAEAVGVHRVTVTRWRLYSPHFQAALNERRQAIWAASLDRLRSLVPLALDAVANELTNAESPNRLQAAFGLLKLVPLAMAAPTGPTDSNEIVRQIVEEERKKAHGPLDDLLADGKGLPPFEEHVRQAWNELSAKLETASVVPVN